MVAKDLGLKGLSRVHFLLHAPTFQPHPTPLPPSPNPYEVLERRSQMSNIGALIIRIGFGGPLYYNYNKEPPK